MCMKNSNNLNKLLQGVKILLIFSLIFGPLIFFIYDSSSMLTEHYFEVYCHNGKYGLREDGLLIKEHKLTPPQYVSIDTINKIFTYEIQAESLGGRKISANDNDLYIAKYEDNKLDVFAKKYTKKRAIGYRGLREKLFKLIDKCDSISFNIETAHYLDPQSFSKKYLQYPVNMIVFYKDGRKNVISYRGSKSIPELELDPLIAYNEAIYAQ